MRQSTHLHDEVWSVRSNTRDTDACFCCAEGSSQACHTLATALILKKAKVRTSECHLIEVRTLVDKQGSGGQLTAKAIPLCALLAMKSSPTSDSTHHAEERRERGRKLVGRHVDPLLTLRCEDVEV